MEHPGAVVCLIIASAISLAAIAFVVARYAKSVESADDRDSDHM